MYYNDQEASNYEPSADYYTENDVAVPWTEFYRWNTNKESISTVAFDHFAELLWIGHQDGRLSSYTFPDMTNYTSIRSHNHPVSAILSCPRSVAQSISISPALFTFRQRNRVHRSRFSFFTYKRMRLHPYVQRPPRYATIAMWNTHIDRFVRLNSCHFGRRSTETLWF